MAREVERKFLVADEAWRGHAGTATAIEQFYVAIGDDRSVRLRILDGRTARLTLKFGSDTHIRDEFEYDVALADALEMRNFAVGEVIEKSRYPVRHGGLVFEVDVYGGALSGLKVAELETERTVADADLPGWLGREITGMAAYSNARLALHGLVE